MDTVEMLNVLGAVIGLARSVEGNKNRPSKLTSDAFLAGMYAALPGTGLSTNHVNQVIQNLHREKERLVPQCSTCQDTCSRNDDYSLWELADLEPELLALKDALLSGLLSLEPLLRGKPDSPLYHQAMEVLYQGFFFMGEDCEKEELKPLLYQVCEVQRALWEASFA